MTDRTNNAHNKSNGSNGSGSLEQQIAHALTDPNITAAQLAELISNSETALIDARTIARRMQEIVDDPVASPDAAKAQEAAQFAQLVVRRLENVIPRLQERHRQVATKARVSRWNEAADVRQGERDAMAAEFAEKYPALINQLVDLFERIRTTNQDVDSINGAAPNSESRRVSPLGHQQILTATKLLTAEGQQVWPPVTAPILPQDVMPALPPMPRDWHQTIDQRNRERYAESQRVAAYYKGQQEQREEREKAARARNGASP